MGRFGAFFRNTAFSFAGTIRTVLQNLKRWTQSHGEKLPMDLLDGRFDDFRTLYPTISQASFSEDYKNFAIEEFKRFHSIAGTILESILPEEERVGERLYSQILLRSLFENFFWLIYIFDDPDDAARHDRLNKYLNGFKNQYYKLHNEVALPHKSQLAAPDPGGGICMHQTYEMCLRR